MKANYLYLIIIYFLISLNIASNTNSFLNKIKFNVELEDHPCELKTSMIISHLLNKTELPQEYFNYFKMLFYTGTGPNDLGDYIGCEKMNISKYFTISVNKSLIPTPIRMELCYLKECDVDFLNKFKEDLANILKNYRNITVDPNSLVIQDPKVELNKLIDRTFVGFRIIASLIRLLVILNILQCIFIHYKNTDKVRTNLLYEINEDKSTKKSILESEKESHRSRRDTSIVRKLLKFFDFVQNISKILEEKNDKKASIDALSVFDGIKFITAFWIVWCHTFKYFVSMSGVKNPQEIVPLILNFRFCFVLSGPQAVAIFFYVSGFLMNLNIQGYLNKKINSFKLFSFALFNRIIRLYPIYLFAVIGMTYILPYVSNGPNYYSLEDNNEVCPSYFWTNLLFLQNLYYIPGNKMCAYHTWYIANDMQFFILTIFIFLFLNNFKKIRNIIFGILLISSLIYCYNNALENDYQGSDASHTHNPNVDYFMDFYSKPWHNISSFIIGIYF